ncbi:ParB/RepB/Spo0J family partition protein [Roseobacter weihaiensis]|uniref:ParB/RepB/Spo0J family partition protein n=1 Tax=Roseobacter weihaiensis TaxID=2763262 RepID=UPI001D0ACC81|nr:ParB/RepB/Spo0J family partition protein [Roseobacter sp. H9]
MSKQDTMIAETAISTGTQRFPLADTYVSEHNPRANEEIDQDSIQQLAETIITSGLIQNLCGLIDEDGKVGIVAGRRRWHALQIAVKVRPDLAMIDVQVTDDLMTARSWALHENEQREQMDIVDKIRAYAGSQERGLSVSQIAAAYCVTEQDVYRFVALGALPAPVLDALKAGHISISDAKAFTICDDEAKILGVLEQCIEGYGWSAYQIKQALNDDKLDADCRSMRFVGLKAYTDAGGTLDTNLFDDDATVADPTILDDLVETKLTEDAEAFRKEHDLAWVEVVHDSHVMRHDLTRDGTYCSLTKIPGVLTDEQQARFEELDDGPWWQLDEDEREEKDALKDILEGDYSTEQRAMSGAVVYITRSGDLSAVIGLVKAEDRAKAVEAGFLKSDEVLAAEKAAEEAAMVQEAAKSPYANSFMEDMAAIRLAAFQTALLRKPEMVLDLLAFGLSRGSHWGTETMAVRFDFQRNKPQGEDDAFTLHRDLGGERPDDEIELDEDDAEDANTAEAFHAFVEGGKKSRNAHITGWFARAFKTQDAEFMALIADRAGADMREVWTPTAANCFKRHKGWQLDDLFMGLLDREADDTQFLAFKKLKKRQKDETMHGLFHSADVQEAYKVTPAQKARIDAWVPECF